MPVRRLHGRLMQPLEQDFFPTAWIITSLSLLPVFVRFLQIHAKNQVVLA